MNAMIIDQKDNVAVAVEQIAAGDAVETAAGCCGVTAKEPIPIFHKVALKDIPAGENVVKYGEHIGIASKPIAAGQHVHTHNVADHREAL